MSRRWRTGAGSTGRLGEHAGCRLFITKHGRDLLVVMAGWPKNRSA